MMNERPKAFQFIIHHCRVPTSSFIPHPFALIPAFLWHGLCHWSVMLAQIAPVDVLVGALRRGETPQACPVRRSQYPMR
ncbi:MAG: hypothetical protein WCB68_17215 [Pyrinomonadaceae bacterium]